MGRKPYVARPFFAIVFGEKGNFTVQDEQILGFLEKIYKKILDISYLVKYNFLIHYKNITKK